MPVEVKELYRSANGDRWCLVRDPGSGRVLVRHEPNAPSGGRARDIEIGDFLARGGHGPEHAELLRLIGTLGDEPPPARDRPGAGGAPPGVEAPRPAPISRYPAPALGEVPEDVRARILAAQEKSGFVPNVFLLLARRPEEFRAFMAYHDALMDREGGLTKAEREMIVVATSAANQCQYCVVAHGAILRIRAKDPLIADQVAANYRKAEVTPRQRAMLDFAMKVSRRAEEVEEEDCAVLRGHGFSEEDVWDIAAIAAFFAMSNRLANFAGLRPNREFYALGRG
jgi:uncharacterized peroxidase-related enzyme